MREERRGEDCGRRREIEGTVAGRAFV